MLELVIVRGSVSIQEIVDELHISAATARRDLNGLADQRLVTRTHGGAMALGSGYELPLQYKAPRNAEAKAAIAAAVADMVNFGDVIGLNGGTTTSEVSRAIGRAEKLIGSGDEPGVTIVTNALNIAFELSIRSHVKIVVTGGVARRQSYELVGPLVGDTIKSLSLDVAILGVDGLSVQFGATTIHEGEADVSRQLASVAGRVIIVADASKVGKATFARICDLEKIDTLVTDAPLGDAMRETFDLAGVEVIVAA
ncbi:DeoR/GlpR family DNA-binding transcription regulator [Parafrigoribacterium mesophilum]|uniref:DeoR/GlpR family DNA-binding transcription regulator n=1 Tax=Parafrigoribacterium mesophilum TaxID=433646 RepID=UPI0031FD849E